MAQGTITRLAEHGYGFIDYGAGEEIFFHGTALEDITKGQPLVLLTKTDG